MVWSKVHQSAIVVDLTATAAASNFGAAFDEAFSWIDARSWEVTVNTSHPADERVVYFNKDRVSITGQVFNDQRLFRVDFDDANDRLVMYAHNPGGESNNYADISSTWTLGSSTYNAANTFTGGTFEFWTSDQDDNSYLLIYRLNNTAWLFGSCFPESSMWKSGRSDSSSQPYRKHSDNPIFLTRTSQGMLYTTIYKIAALSNTQNYAYFEGTVFPTIVMGSNQWYLGDDMIGINTTNSDIGVHYHWGGNPVTLSTLGTGFIGDEYYIEMRNGDHDVIFSTGNVNPGFVPA